MVTLATLRLEAQVEPTPLESFRAGTDLISVDIVVRDDSGAVVRELSPADFEVREDGVLQSVVVFTFEEISGTSSAPVTVELLAGVEERVLGGTPGTPSLVVEAPQPLTPEALSGRRLVVLLFDVSSMQPEDVDRAVDAAVTFVTEQMDTADLIAVATVGAQLDVLTDFTDDAAEVLSALSTLSFVDGTGIDLAAGTTLVEDEAAATEDEPTNADDTSGFDLFNNDARLRALRVLAETLGPINQKKAILYFTSGMQRSGADNRVEMRAATNAAVRANVALYTVDARGLQALVPGGDATQRSQGGRGVFSGSGIAQQFSRLAASQDTLVSLAEDTGGQAFLDTNDFGDAFARVRADLSAYYLLGYVSTNTTQDGRYRRIDVRVVVDDLHVDAREGYYAERDFAHTNNTDRERQLEDELAAAVSATDLPILMAGGWFRLAPDRYYVPVSVAIPGAAAPVLEGEDEVSLDVIGQFLDERGLSVGRIRETITVPISDEAGLVRQQILYQSSLTLPPGSFAAKLVVRENATGRMGSFEAPLIVPDLEAAALKVSSVILSTDTRAGQTRTDNPLVQGGVQLVPNLTHVVQRAERLYVHYEVYDPARPAGGAPHLLTSLAFYRGDVKVFETPVVEHTTIDAPGRAASIFQFELAPGSLEPGVYICQINIIDAEAGSFAFPRVTVMVR
jgi:VWFA-related protein